MCTMCIFIFRKNLAQPVTEFSASILDTEHSLENLKNEVLFYGLQCIQKMEAVPSDIALCRRVMEYIGNHYTDASLSVSQVAANFQLHPSYLGSVFKKVQHTSVLQYISDIRISAAQKLLKEGTMKISEVAETSGYSDVYYFSKKFKKACGCSPKEYAAKIQLKTGMSNDIPSFSVYKSILLILLSRPLPPLHTLCQKILDLSVHRTKLILCPLCDLIVKLLGKSQWNLFFTLLFLSFHFPKLCPTF